MDRRRFLLGAWLTGAGRLRSWAEVDRPNVLIVLADGWRAQSLPAEGKASLRVPHFQRLSAESVVFTRAYTPYPSCGPARAALLTGFYPHRYGLLRDGIRLSNTVTTIARYASRAGYVTGFIGRWALDGPDEPGFVPPERRHGFAEWAAYNQGTRWYGSVYFRDMPEPLRAEGFEPDHQTALAIEFCTRHRDRLFMLVLAYGPPHPPRVAPPEWLELYAKVPLEVAANVPASQLEQARQALRAYYAACSAVDACLGKLLEALEQLELSQRTVVVFTADHGDLLGAHGQDGASSFYEESIRVPLLVRHPKQRRSPRQVHSLVSLVSLAPTVLSWLGIPEATGDAGPLPLHQSTPPTEAEESVYCYGRLGAPDEWRAIVRGWDKLVVDRELNPTHLFNLALDPYELDNLVQERSERRKRDELLARLKVWMQRLGDRILPSGLKVRD